ncbi:LysR substrate-binding domain-containing protein [Neorhizobium sp. DAR64861/K0K2]|uniref:LysR substrate-binding domain-containing protein n=1 Tax=unclassified Neorhizobium TaxID=2629175 RepID=UPI003D29818A
MLLDPNGRRPLEDRADNSRNPPQGRALYPWRFEGADGVLDVDVENVVTVNDTELLLSAAREGLGLAYLIEDLVEPYLKTNELKRVLEPACKLFPGFYLYYSERSHMAASVRAFIDFMKARSS